MRHYPRSVLIDFTNNIAVFTREFMQHFVWVDDAVTHHHNVLILPPLIHGALYISPWILLYDGVPQTRGHKTHVSSAYTTILNVDQGPLLLTWFNFNPSMDK